VRANLTPALIAKASVPDGKGSEIFWDLRQASFGFRVKHNGHRSFVIHYRDAGGRSRLMTIPAVLGLEKARKRARQLLGEVAHGRDPLGERRKEKDAQRNTLRAVSEEYFARKGKHLRSAYEWRKNMERAVLPVLGSRPIAEIRRSEISRLQDKLEDERGPASSDASLAVLRRIMNWHATRSDDFRPPLVRGMMRHNSKENARAHILTDAEIAAVFKAADETPGPFGAFVKFLLLTAARRDEAARMVWSEVDGTDWTLPAARNKTKQDLTRPLSKAALEVLASLPRFASSPYVFTVSGRTAFRNFGKAKVRLDAQSGVTGWTLHDLRRTSRSLLSRAGVNADHAERCLGHVIGGVRGVYDRHAYRQEMLHAYEALAAQIEQIVNPKDNVVAMRK
jgi:integrase